MLIPDQPQVGDAGLSFQWTDAVSNQLERLSLFGANGSGISMLHYGVLSEALQPSYMDDTTPQTATVDIWGRSGTGQWRDTGTDIEATNRSRGYYYSGSAIMIFQNPQSGEWHPIYPSGDMVIGKTDGSLSPSGTATLSIYSWNGAAWADTTHNVTIRDVFQWTVSASKFVAARLWDYQNLWIPIAAEC